jgi:cysteinyl-tRNA synthetase
MARAVLGREVIDLHSGGEDNIFPHHECEIAQSRGASGREAFATQWLHTRFLLVEGQKMSKSKGNFFTARDLFALGHEPAAVRLELIKTHYRVNANFTVQGLKDSARTVDRWRRFAESAWGRQGPAGEAAVEHEFAAALADDLNVAGALAAINVWINSLERPTTGDAARLMRLDAVLGLLGLERPAAAASQIGLFVGGLSPDPVVLTLLEARRQARTAKNFAESDRIRDELAAMGYAIKDVTGGKVEVSRA